MPFDSHPHARALSQGFGHLVHHREAAWQDDGLGGGKVNFLLELDLLVGDDDELELLRAAVRAWSPRLGRLPSEVQAHRRHQREDRAQAENLLCHRQDRHPATQLPDDERGGRSPATAPERAGANRRAYRFAGWSRLQHAALTGSRELGQAIPGRPWYRSDPHGAGRLRARPAHRHQQDRVRPRAESPGRVPARAGANAAPRKPRPTTPAASSAPAGTPAGAPAGAPAAQALTDSEAGAEEA